MRVLAFFAGLTAVAADDLAAELRMLTSNASNATTANTTNVTDALTISSGATMQTPITAPSGITGDKFAKLLCGETTMQTAVKTFAATAAAAANSKITASMVGNHACTAGTRRARELAAAAAGFKLKASFDIVIPKADMATVFGASSTASKAMADAQALGKQLDTVLTGYKTNGLPAALQTGFKTALQAALNSSTFVAALTAAGVTDVTTWQATAVKAATTDWTVTSIVSATVTGKGSYKGAAPAATSGAATQAIAAVFMMASSVMLF